MKYPLQIIKKYLKPVLYIENLSLNKKFNDKLEVKKLIFVKKTCEDCKKLCPIWIRKNF